MNAKVINDGFNESEMIHYVNSEVPSNLANPNATVLELLSITYGFKILEYI